jgi:hypothetical protein
MNALMVESGRPPAAPPAGRPRVVSESLQSIYISLSGVNLTGGAFLSRGARGTGVTDKGDSKF